jgi:hypothetical protein
MPVIACSVDHRILTGKNRMGHATIMVGSLNCNRPWLVIRAKAKLHLAIDHNEALRPRLDCRNPVSC